MPDIIITETLELQTNTGQLPIRQSGNQMMVWKVVQYSDHHSKTVPNLVWYLDAIQ